MKAGFWPGMVIPVFLAQRIVPDPWCVSRNICQMNECDDVWGLIFSLSIYSVGCVLCFLRPLLCLVSHIHIWDHWNDDTNLFLLDHIHLFSPVYSAAIWTINHCLEYLFSSYSLKKLFRLYYLFPSSICLFKIVVYFCYFFLSTQRYQIPGHVLFCPLHFYF